MDTRVGSHSVIDETVAENVQIDDYVSCGPRAYLRPGTHLCDHSKAGTHVEIKKSTIGVGSKVPHLSYIGDTTMGANVNIGAGSITCNYDGVHKNATTIGDNTFIGSDTMMVAPVNIGADAVTGAGGTITKDVPDGALALERTEQRIIPGYTEPQARAAAGQVRSRQGNTAPIRAGAPTEGENMPTTDFSKSMPMFKTMRVYSGTANRPLAEKIAKILGVELSGLALESLPTARSTRVLTRPSVAPTCSLSSRSAAT